jgi:hypothetical protein
MREALGEYSANKEITNCHYSPLSGGERSGPEKRDFRILRFPVWPVAENKTFRELAEITGPLGQGGDDHACRFGLLHESSQKRNPVTPYNVIE